MVTEDDLFLQRLNELRDLANEGLSAAFKVRDKIGGAVNWRDLSCAEALLVTDHNGDSRLCVVIEEAAPDAGELQAFIAGYLKREFGAVEVKTGW